MNQQSTDLPHIDRELANIKARLKRIELFLESFTSVADTATDLQIPDELFQEAIMVVAGYDRASASLLQRKMSIGYARAVIILDQLADKQLVSSDNKTTNPRQVYKDKIQAYLDEIEGGKT